MIHLKILISGYTGGFILYSWFPNKITHMKHDKNIQRGYFGPRPFHFQLNNLFIISNDEVWRCCTWHLLKARDLEQCCTIIIKSTPRGVSQKMCSFSILLYLQTFKYCPLAARICRSQFSVMFAFWRFYSKFW